MCRVTHPVYPIIHPTLSTRPRSTVMLADCDPKEMEESEEPVGPLDGKFEYKKSKDGTISNRLWFAHTADHPHRKQGIK